jgi:serine/threonine protein kinase
VIGWAVELCDVLNYLHGHTPEPIVFRDMKPSNVMVNSRGRIMLVDFGIAKIYDPQLKTTTGARALTPGYSPPEQYGFGTTDSRSDIYAVGATLYHLLTGYKHPPTLQEDTCSSD